MPLFEVFKILQQSEPLTVYFFLGAFGWVKNLKVFKRFYGVF